MKGLSYKTYGLSANTLKYYAIIAMTIDHIGWAFVDTFSALGQIMHIIGRTVAPIMCYFIVEGFHNTRNVKKYLLRMVVFALISWVPYFIMRWGILPLSVNLSNGSVYIIPEIFTTQSVMYTFTICITMLIVQNNDKIKTVPKILITGILIIAAYFGDWLFIAPIWVMIFEKFRGNFKKQAFGFTISSIILITFIIDGVEYLFQYSVLLALVPLSFYNGKRGVRKSGKAAMFLSKWVFYIYYPLHMIIIGILRICIK